MNIRLFYFEMLGLLRQPAFGMALVLMAGLFIFAARYQQVHIAEQNGRLNGVITKEAEALEASKERLAQVENGELQFDSMWDDPRGYYTWHRQVIRYPDNPLAFMAVGQRDLYNPLVEVGIFKPAEVEGLELANPVPRLLGTFDPAFVIVFLMPLFIIGFTHGLVSRMREEGTLTLLLSAANPSQLLILKTLPRFLILTSSVWLCFLVSLVFSGVNFSAHLSSIVWVLVAISAYALFFFLAALVLDLNVRSSGSHAVALIGLWAVVCILLPTAISTVSKEIYPIPSGMETTNAARIAGNEKREQAQEILAKYYEDHPEMAVNSEIDEAHKGFFDYYRRTLSMGFAVEDAVRPTLDKQASRIRQQNALEQSLAAISPAAVMTSILEVKAGSASGQYRAFENSIIAFSREWREYFQEKAFASDLIGSADLEVFPAFQDGSGGDPSSSSSLLAFLIAFDAILLVFIIIQLRRRGALALLRGGSA